MDVRTREAVRYLGYGGHAADEQTLALLEDSFGELEETAKRRIIYRIFDVVPGEAGSLLTDQRQEDAARRALEALDRALEALESGLTPDAVLTDAEEALDAIGELTGRTAREEIVERIFSRFCVGK